MLDRLWRCRDAKDLHQAAYEPADDGDGTRVLVDRIWPRGVSKDEARIDHWLRNLAPSKELRVWYGHDPARFEEFRHRYEAELGAEPASSALAQLRNLAAGGPVTLVFGARDTEHSNAAVLRELLRSAG